MKIYNNNKSSPKIGLTFVGLAENTNPNASRTPMPINDCDLLRELIVSIGKEKEFSCHCDKAHQTLTYIGFY